MDCCDTLLLSVFRMCEQWIKVAELEMFLDGFHNDSHQSVVYCIFSNAFIKYVLFVSLTCLRSFTCKQ